MLIPDLWFDSENTITKRMLFKNQDCLHALQLIQGWQHSTFDFCWFSSLLRL